MGIRPTIADRPPRILPAGERTGVGRAVLQRGADLLQTHAPLHGFDAYVVGFHCAKGDPGMQMEAHHFCKIVNDELVQCVLFDGNTRDANLIGIEYIVSERLFDGLDEQEKPYWHPHDYEVLSGELVAPGLPEVAERALMRHLMNSYGKTWHTWHTSGGLDLPTGDPALMWSFNREGECREDLKRDRDEAMGIDPAAKRRERERLLPLARPQRGVDAMRDAFPGAVPIPGVVDAG
jgi:hypothetical protein